MGIRSVVRDKIHQDPDAALMSNLNQVMKILLSAVGGIQLKIVFHGITVIVGWMNVDRREPQGINPQVGQIIQSIPDRPKGRTAEQERDHAIDNRSLYPGWIFMIIVRDARLTILYYKIGAAGIFLTCLIFHAQAQIIFSIGRWRQESDRRPRN